MISMFYSGFLRIMTIDSRAALMLEIEQIVVIDVDDDTLFPPASLFWFKSASFDD